MLPGGRPKPPPASLSPFLAPPRQAPHDGYGRRHQQASRQKGAARTRWHQLPALVPPGGLAPLEKNHLGKEDHQQGLAAKITFSWKKGFLGTNRTQ